MKKMKKYLSICLISFLTLALFTGCSQDASNDGEEKKANLVFWNVGLKSTDDTGEKTQDELALFKFIEKFENEHPDVKVEVVDQPAENIASLLKASSVSKEGPDLVGLWSGTATNDFKDILLPLDEFLSDEELSQYSGLDIARADFDPKGKVQALPYNITAYNLYYNKKVMKEAVGEFEEPKTWDEFLALCEKVKKSGVTPLYVGEQEGYTSTWVVSEFLLDQVGPEGISRLRSGGQKFNSPEFQKSMEAWMKVFDKGFTNENFVTLAAWDSMQQFATSGAAMTINGSWGIRDLTVGLGDDLGVMQIPAISFDAKYGDYLVSQPGANISVTTFTKNKEEAAAFAKFITSADFQMAYYEDTGDIPAKNQVDPNKIDNPTTKEALTWIQKGKNGIGFDSIIPGDAAAEFYKLASSVAAGKMSVEEMGKKVDEKIK
jgi:raffinose/stachyose/melibiose transport system substrate-binding protein